VLRHIAILTHFTYWQPRSDSLMVAVGFNPRTAVVEVDASRSDAWTAAVHEASLTRRKMLGTPTRGLKPTATVAWSLRDRPRRAPAR